MSFCLHKYKVLFPTIKYFISSKTLNVCEYASIHTILANLTSINILYGRNTYDRSILSSFKNYHGSIKIINCAYSISKNELEKMIEPKIKKVSEDLLTKRIKSGPNLEYFISNLGISQRKLTKRQARQISHPYVSIEDINGHGQTVFFEVHGCQMNVNDTEIAWSVLQTYGYTLVHKPEEANIILIMTCAIREGAELKIWDKLKSFRQYKKNKLKNVKIGILGCMAERLKMDLIEKEECIDIVAGPDSYMDLPRLLAIAENGEKSMNVLLSHDETYANVKPVTISSDKITAFVSIMRGCDNLCTYCIVPFTRGKERSRDMESIIEEIKYLTDKGVKEIVLLGQNVNSYRDYSEKNYFLANQDHYNSPKESSLAKGFKTVYKQKIGGKTFADLINKISLLNPEIRIRFTSPHPKDFPDEVLQVIRERANICKCLHLPAQSGNSRILELMRRGYSREAYLELVLHIRSILPTINLTSDFICGFCGETEEEFEETMSLLREVQYSFCYIFPYSMREKTAAHRNLEDSVLHSVKVNRVNRLHQLFRDISLQLNMSQIGKHHLILVEGISKRSKLHLAGRNDGNLKVIIPDLEMQVMGTNQRRWAKPGDFIDVIITGATSQTLKAIPVGISSIGQFSYRPIHK